MANYCAVLTKNRKYQSHPRITMTPEHFKNKTTLSMS